MGGIEVEVGSEESEKSVSSTVEPETEFPFVNSSCDLRCVLEIMVARSWI